MSDNVKMTVNINKEAASSLKELAAKQGTNMTVIVNKAIALEKFMYDAVANDGEIQIKQKDGTVRSVILR